MIIIKNIIITIPAITPITIFGFVVLSWLFVAWLIIFEELVSLLFVLAPIVTFPR